MGFPSYFFCLFAGVLATPRAVLSPPLPRAPIRGNFCDGGSGGSGSLKRFGRGSNSGSPSGEFRRDISGKFRGGGGLYEVFLLGVFARLGGTVAVSMSVVQEWVLPGLRYVCARLAAQLPRVLLKYPYR